MTMYMSDILCVTNRKLCQEDFLTRIEQIAVCHPAGIILREKDLTTDSLKALMNELISDKAELANIEKNAKEMAILDSRERIADIILSLAK